MLYALIVGGLAGWLAGLVVKGKGSGIFMNIILGIIGAFVGAFLLRSLNASGTAVLGLQAGSFWGDLASGTIGAIVILLLARVLAR